MMRPLCFVVALLVALPAFAEQIRVFYSSGTGFFISPYGELITNAHVIKDCHQGSIQLKGAIHTTAQLIAMDEQHDLALLRATHPPRDAAKLAATETSIVRGDPVMVMGYPANRRSEYSYSIAHAEVLDVKGPQGEPTWYQFSDSAQQGNSGGPLLDNTGNVIGVVTGKSELIMVNERTRERQLIGSADIAVALPILKQFLLQNHIRFQQADSRVMRSNQYIESRARDFISQVHCITGEERLK